MGSAADKKMDEAGKKVEVFGDKLKSCDGAVKNVNKVLGTLIKTAAASGMAGAAGMGAFAKSSLDTYKDFQQSMANTGAIAGAEKGSADFKALEKAAREAGRSTSKTAQESADALGYMALAGWKVEEQINGLMPILRLSEATGADLAMTSDLVTDSMSAMGIKTEELSKYLDVAANANNKTNQTATQMLETFIGAGGMFKELGTSMEEAAALSGVLANRGIKGSEGATSLNSILINLMGNSKSSAMALERLGVSAYDSNGKFKGVTQTLEEISAAMKNASDEDRGWFLSKLGGKTQIDTLNALLSGIETLNKDGVNEVRELTAEFEKSNGALEKMADAMRNTFSGSMAIAGSAMDDFKITIGEKLEPYISRFLNWFAEKLPGAAEKVSLWLDRNLPKAINFLKSAFEKIKPVIGFVIDHFSELISVATGFVVALASFSVIPKVYSWYKKLRAAGSALKAVQLALNTSMLACPLTWLAAAVGTVVGALSLYSDAVEEAKEIDLAEHFGDIELSAEECSKVIQSVFGPNVYKETDLVTAAYEEAKKSIEALSEASGDLNKLNFKLSLDPKSVPKEEYLKVADEYIKNMNAALKDQQYALDVDIKLMISDTELAASFSKDTAAFYGKLSGKSQELGTKLKQAVENAYKHNWDFDSSEAVSAILNEQTKIQDKIAAAQSEAKLETLKYDFAHGDLSAESYVSLMEAAKEETGKLRETYDQSRTNTIANAKIMYAGNSAKIAEITEEANRTYAQKVSELGGKSIALGGASIVSAYEKEFKMAAEQFKSWEESTLNQKDVYNFLDEFNNGNMSAESFENALINIGSVAAQSSSISGIQRENIAELYEAMQTDVEAMREDVKNLETVPQELQNALLQADLIGAIGGDEDSKLHLGAMIAAKSLSPEKAQELFEASEKFGENCPKGIFSDKNIQEGLTAAEDYRNFISERLSQPYTIDADLKINFNTTTSFTGPVLPETSSSASVKAGVTPKKIITPKPQIGPQKSKGLKTGPNIKKGNATGTPYFGGGLTKINEHGGEIINLPTGAQIIPSDKSAQMVRENAKYRTPNINMYNISPAGFSDMPYFGSGLKSMSGGGAYSDFPVNRGADSNIKNFGDINVNVTIGGNIVGIEDFADEIGGIVSGKFVDAIRAV